MSTQDSLALVGSVIDDKYEVTSVAGIGGFGVVFKATHLLFQRTVALKVFSSLADFDAVEQKRLLEGFLQEAKVLADLSEKTPSICQARDVGVIVRGERQIPYMVLEWLEGENLEVVLDREKAAGMTPRTLEEAVALLEPVAEGLALAHRLHIAHRDIKPSNIFVIGDARGEPTVKLLDFGIAKVVSDAQKEHGFTRTTGVVTSFTPVYGAPEQFARSYGPTGPWTDVFALALVVVETVLGREALAGETLADVGRSSTDEAKRPSPATLGLTVDPAVEQVFLKALAVKPSDRYADAGELWNALRESMGLEPARSVAPSSALGARLGRLRESRPTPTPASSGSAGAAPIPSSASVLSHPIALPEPAAKQTPHVPVALSALAAAIVVGIGVAIFGLSPKSKSVAHNNVPVPSAPSSASVVAIVAPTPTCPKGMIEIPGGRFFMGSDDADALPFEKPAHNVTLSPYCMDELEVTTAKYVACSDSGECRRAGTTNEWKGITSGEQTAFDPLCNARDRDAKGKHPINCVTWQMADEFCKNAGGRLPTEAEWEFAARGPDGRKYPWGDEPPGDGTINACGKECVAWGKAHHQDETAMYAGDDGFATTAPVGSFPKGKSRYGIQDVVGNVWEWTADRYGDYGADALTDPKGPTDGDDRVIRGGAWNGGYAAWVRPTFRFHQLPTTRSYGVGFRCAADLR